MEKEIIRISVRNLVEFILRSGDLDSGKGTADKEAMQKGRRISGGGPAENGYRI